MGNDLDQFYTPEATAKSLIEAIKTYFSFDDFDNIIEPSAGTGAFFKNLPGAIGLDLEPKFEGIIEQDFFEFKFPAGRNIVVGNPPYGRRGSLASKFINQSADYADVIAFVLPRGFRRKALQNTLDARLHLVYEEEVEDFVMPDGSIHKVKSVFQIWEKRSMLRTKHEDPKTHKDFDMLHKHLSWITEEELKNIQSEYPLGIGQNKMRVQDSSEFSKGSVWFIKPKVDGVKEVLSKCAFKTAYYTTGAPSLSKGDIIIDYTNNRN